MADYSVLDVLGVGSSTQETPQVKEEKPQKKEPAKKKTQTKKTTNKPASIDSLIFPQKKETKSRRLQVLMKPSTYDKLKDTADANGTNVNELINVILENFLG